MSGWKPYTMRVASLLECITTRIGSTHASIIHARKEAQQSLGARVSGLPGRPSPACRARLNGNHATGALST